MAIPRPEAAAMQRSFWKATADIWKLTAIRVITICRGSGAAPVGHISADTLSTLFPKESSMTTASRQYRESSTAIGCLPLKTPLTKKYSGNYEKRKQLRLEKEKPVLEAFWSWLDQQKPVRNTRLDKAVNYVLNRRDIAETIWKTGGAALPIISVRMRSVRSQWGEKTGCSAVPWTERMPAQ